MKKGTKIWIIVAAALLAFGMFVMLVALAINGWNFRRVFGGEQYVSNTYKIEEEFTNISVEVDTQDVRFVRADGECKAVCYEKPQSTHSVSVQDGTLVIKGKYDKKWYEFFSFESPKVDVYLPEKTYDSLSLKASTGDVYIAKECTFNSINVSLSTGDVKNYASAVEKIKIKTSTGNIYMENIATGLVELSVSTGDITAINVDCAGDIKIGVDTGDTTLKNVSCKNLSTNGDTGDLSLQNVLATEKFSIERDTGDVRFDGCDAAEISVKTSTGDVKGSLLSDKIFIVQTSTGKIKVPETLSGGKCKIVTSTGDVSITIVT